MDILGIQLNFDFSWIYNLGDQPLYVIMWHFFLSGGWMMFVAAFIYGGWIYFVYSQQNKFGRKQSFIMLAIDVPKNNLQTPRAVENIFSALAGAHTPLDWHEKKFKGEFQLGFSLEIVSIDGYIQFLIRTPKHYRDLVEAAIYSQYPEAEIAEVHDYMDDINVTFPSDEYNLWGADLVLVKKSYFPIKTYKEFQEELDKEFKDPMAALLEVMSKIGTGEQIWFQIIIVPSDNDWHKEGLKYVNKEVGVKEKVKNNILDSAINIPLSLISQFSEHLTGQGFGLTEEEAAKEKKEEFNMMRLNPMQKREVEAVLNKIDKVCFKCKARFVYYGKREVFKKGLGVSGMMGAIKQFNATGLNGFKPGDNKTQAKLFAKGYRNSVKQNKVLMAYKARNPDTTTGLYLLSVEELATLYHFPYIEVKAPMVKMTEAKRAMSPVGLPLEESQSFAEDYVPQESKSEEKTTPIVDYDNDYFEKRFAVDKTGKSDQERKQKILSALKKAPRDVKPEDKEKKRIKFIKATPETLKEDGTYKKQEEVPDNLPFAE